MGSKLKNKGIMALAAVFVLSTAFGVFIDQAEAGRYSKAKPDKKVERCEWPDVQLEKSEVEVYLNDNFEYWVTVKGDKRSYVTVEGLLKGLSYNRDRGAIEGRAKEAGTFDVTVTASNDCGNDHAYFTIKVTEKKKKSSGPTSGSTSSRPSSSRPSKERGDANVSLESELIINPDGSGIYLSQIPYTGAGDVLQYALTSLAMLLWMGALTFVSLSPTRKERVRSFFYRLLTLDRSDTLVSVIDRSVSVTIENSEEESYQEIEDVNERLMQSLRSKSLEDKILFSETALRELASYHGEDAAEENLNKVIENAKATYPRIDGYVRIDSERLKEIL